MSRGRGKSGGNRPSSLKPQFDNAASAASSAAPSSPQAQTSPAAASIISKSLPRDQFNQRSITDDLIKRIADAIYPNNFRGDPAHHKWQDVSNSLKGNNNQYALQALPEVKKEIAARALFDVNKAIESLTKMGATEKLADPKTYTAGIRDQNYVSTLQNVIEKLAQPGIDKRKIITEAQTGLHDRHKAWQGNINQQMQDQIIPHLAERLLKTPPQQWNNIIPADMSKQQLEVLKGQVSVLAVKSVTNMSSITDKVEALAKSSPVSLPEMPEGLNRYQKNRFDAMVNAQFKNQREAFMSQVEKLFGNDTKDVVGGSFIAGQKKIIADTIPTSKETIYGEETLASVMSGAKDTSKRGLEIFQEHTNSFFTQRLAQAPDADASVKNLADAGIKNNQLAI